MEKSADHTVVLAAKHQVVSRQIARISPSVMPTYLIEYSVDAVDRTRALLSCLSENNDDLMS